jgi:preprotein translocase subunit SecA
LNATDIAETIKDVAKLVMEQMTHTYIPPQSMEEVWNVPGLEQALQKDFNLSLPLAKWLEEDTTLDEDKLHERIHQAYNDAYQQKEVQIGTDIMRQFEKAIMLQMLDTCWREHLAAMDYLRQGIHLRGYAQKNPKQEYKRESFALFSQLLDKINYDVISALSKFEVRVEQDMEQLEQNRRDAFSNQQIEYKHGNLEALQDSDVVLQEEAPYSPQQTFVRGAPKVGRNDPCPCGSNKKFKQCHGNLAEGNTP